MMPLKTLRDIDSREFEFDQDFMKMEIQKQAINWIKELQILKAKHDKIHYSFSAEVRLEKETIKKFGFSINHDNEYSTHEETINTLIDFIIKFFNIIEKDLK